jgi:protein-S-isoprenylcysteine O-methyltransferase Ste14
VALGLLLFLPAGTWRWPQAWAFLAEAGILSLVVSLWLLRHDPALLRERLASPVQAGQKRWDQVGMAGLSVFWGAWFVLIALDAKRFHWSSMSAPWHWLGAAGLAVSLYAAYRTFRENSFAAPVVKVQQARGHRVVSTGPYRLVRHPMYAGAVSAFFGIPLLLGSWWGVALAPVLCAALAARAVLEERELEAGLEGYAEYKMTVRYRLIPFVW